MLPRPSHTQPILGLREDVTHHLNEVALVALQHLLPSLPPLFSRFVEAGIPSDQIFILGKPYSTVPTVAQALSRAGLYVHLPQESEVRMGSYAKSFRHLVLGYWKTVLERLPSSVERIVILDEGGWLSLGVPDEIITERIVVAVEHTMFGVFTTPTGGRPYPVVLMAASAAKTHFENSIIADAIVERLKEAISHLADTRVGIIGLGNIGRAVALTLHAQGIQNISGYDIVSEKARALDCIIPVKNIQALINRCDVLLGCTGRDTLEPRGLLNPVKGHRWLASCSSGDVEFQRVALFIEKQSSGLRTDPFRNASGMIGSTEVILLNGGFPLNFDRETEREHPAHIQLTRELTYASVLQAALCIQDESSLGGIMLDPEVQQCLVETWLANRGGADLFPDCTLRPQIWWEENSGGTRLQSNLGKYIALLPFY